SVAQPGMVTVNRSLPEPTTAGLPVVHVGAAASAGTATRLDPMIAAATTAAAATHLLPRAGRRMAHLHAHLRPGGPGAAPPICANFARSAGRGGAHLWSSSCQTDSVSAPRSLPGQRRR